MKLLISNIISAIIISIACYIFLFETHAHRYGIFILVSETMIYKKINPTKADESEENETNKKTKFEITINVLLAISAIYLITFFMVHVHVKIIIEVLQSFNFTGVLWLLIMIGITNRYFREKKNVLKLIS